MSILSDHVDLTLTRKMLTRKVNLKALMWKFIFQRLKSSMKNLGFGSFKRIFKYIAHEIYFAVNLKDNHCSECLKLWNAKLAFIKCFAIVKLSVINKKKVLVFPLKNIRLLTLYNFIIPKLRDFSFFFLVNSFMDQF